ncbi:hypothetical protein [Streptomyces syringium]|uniref:hypothetical protein n=1 Tax=Streptomyces syringium TaxID=76729 RepID=UPI003454354A
MTIQIPPLAALLIFAGIAVGIVVFKYTARAHGALGRGDLGMSIGSGVAVATLLAVLLAPGFGQASASPPAPSPGPGSATSAR